MTMILGRTLWLINAVTALCVGLTVLGVNVLAYLPQSDNALLILKSVVGISGALSLLRLIMEMTGTKCPGCGNSPCTC